MIYRSRNISQFHWLKMHQKSCLFIMTISYAQLVWWIVDIYMCQLNTYPAVHGWHFKTSHILLNKVGPVLVASVISFYCLLIEAKLKLCFHSCFGNRMFLHDMLLLLLLIFSRRASFCIYISTL